MAAHPVLHPPAEVLKAFGLGKLNDSSSGVVMDHLDQCEDCRKQVAALSGDDFLNRLRQVHGRSSTPAPAKSLAEVSHAAKLPTSQAPIPNLPPELANIPHYEILRELGRGGMGVVYLAHNKLMDRLEVLKVVNKALLNHAGAVERFLREIRAAAKLSHANVVAAYHALQMGELLVFAMEYVEGQDLASLVKTQGPLPIVHACFYVQQAALGLQHAFEKQMVHRDVKPQNLILARDGKKHIVKVLDFGLAKVIREKRDDPGITGEGRMLGTPDYIAPEQTLDAAKADIRADIYSLGCTLYFLLSGRPPFRANSLGAMLLAHQMQEAKALNLVRPEVPQELAAAVRKMMAKSPTQRYQTPREVAQALAACIKPGAAPKSSPVLSVEVAEAKPAVKKAARVDRAAAEAQVQLEPGVVEQSRPQDIIPSVEPQRNQQFSDLSIDSLLGRSVPSVAPGKRRRISKRRLAAAMPEAWKKWLIGGGIGVAVLLLALLGMWAGGVFTGKATDDTPVTENLPADSEMSGDDDKLKVTGAVGDYDLTGGYCFVHFGKDGPRVVLLYNNDKQKQYFARVYDLATGQALTPPLPHKSLVRQASFSPDGKRVATVSDDQTARLWDAASGKEVIPPLQHGNQVLHVSFSPDGQRVVTASVDKTARLWDAASGQALAPPLQHLDIVNHASFSPDGRRLVTASYDKTARLWDAATGKEVSPPLQHSAGVIQASFSPDGKRVVTAIHGTSARLWDAASGKEITRPFKHADIVYHSSFSPDGGRVVTASTDKEARLWDAVAGKQITPPLQHGDTVYHASFSPDGHRVVTASADKTARLWEAATTGKEVAPPLQHEGEVFRASFSPDGKCVVTASGDQTPPWLPSVLRGGAVTAGGAQTARLWDVVTGTELKKVTITPDAFSAGDYEQSGGYRFVHFGKAGPRVVLLYNNDKQKRYFARVYDLATGQALTPPLPHEGEVRHASFSPDGRRLVTASFDNTARVWDTTSGKEVAPPLKHKGKVWHASFSPDGRRVVTTSSYHVTASGPTADRLPDGQYMAAASTDKTARVWDAATGKELTPPLKHDSGVFQASFSPDGRRVATASADATARLWDAASGKEVTLLSLHDGAVAHASFSPDGRRVVTTGWDQSARLWDAGTGKEITPLLMHRAAVGHASFSPDSQRVVTVSADQTARVWDAATGQALTPPLQHGDAVFCALFSPDGSRVVTGSKDKTARVWDAATGQALTPPLPHTKAVNQVSFSPDGQRVVTRSGYETAWLWDASTGKELKKVTITPD